MSDTFKKLPPYCDPALLADYRDILARLRARKTTFITPAQYRSLLDCYRQAQTRGAPLIGWVTGTAHILRQSLLKDGIEITA